MITSRHCSMSRLPLNLLQFLLTSLLLVLNSLLGNSQSLPSAVTDSDGRYNSCMMIEPVKRSTAKDLLRQSDFLKNEIIKYGIQNNPLTLSDDGNASSSFARRSSASKQVPTSSNTATNAQTTASQNKSQGGNRAAGHNNSTQTRSTPSHGHSQSSSHRSKSLTRGAGKR